MTADGETVDGKACPVCMGMASTELPDPWQGQSLFSDLSTTTNRLGRVACLQCGLVRRRCMPSLRVQRAVFGDEYSLHAHQANEHVRRRQAAVAEWILGSVGYFRVGSVLEVGCGDGSLLKALNSLLPEASFVGVEPAPQSVLQAQRRGFSVTQGFAEDISQHAADLCLSVNVIEHVPNSADFLRSMRRAISTGGRVVVVCPDGDFPNYELLFYDHLYSLESHSLASLCARAGLIALQLKKAPSSLGPFQMVVARPAQAEEPEAPIHRANGALIAAKASYLRAWSTLDQVLLERVGNASRIAVFGNSDIAALLRIYAPSLWAQVEACVIDAEPIADRFIDRPLRLCSSLPQGSTIVLGVRPGNHETIASRLTSDGYRVVRWDDVIAA